MTDGTFLSTGAVTLILASVAALTLLAAFLVERHGGTIFLWLPLIWLLVSIAALLLDPPMF